MAFTTALVGSVCPPNGAMFGVSLGDTFLPCTPAKRKAVEFERWAAARSNCASFE